jgi:hypothetical protein
MTKEDFLKIDLNKISQIYSGKDGCRCGCKGKYVSTSFAKDNAEANDKLASKRLKRAKELVEGGAAFDMGDTYIDIKTGEKTVLCLYFDDLA